MDITNEVIQAAAGCCGTLLSNYAGKINAAFLEADDDLSVALKVTFKPAGADMDVKAELNFVAERVKDSARRTVRPNTQRELFPAVGRREYEGKSPGAWTRSRWYGRR